MAFYRRSAEKTLLVIANYQKEERTLALADTVKEVLINNLEELKINDGKLKLSGYQAVVLEVETV